MVDFLEKLGQVPETLREKFSPLVALLQRFKEGIPLTGPEQADAVMKEILATAASDTERAELIQWIRQTLDLREEDATEGCLERFFRYKLYMQERVC